MNISLLLDRFKLSNQIEDIMPILAKEDLLLFILCWTKLRVRWDPPDEWDGEIGDPFDQWDALWSFCSFDLLDASIVSGKTELSVVQLFEQARRHRLIFPDGTIHEAARAAILNYIDKKTEGDLSRFMESEKESTDDSVGGPGYEQ